jgi:hypothetical protein
VLDEFAHTVVLDQSGTGGGLKLDAEPDLSHPGQKVLRPETTSHDLIR